MAAYKGSENGLNVPEDILQIERRLTDMFEVKNEAAEKKLHEERKVQSEAEDKQRKKRKRDEEELRAEVRGNAETDDVAKRSKPNAVCFVFSVKLTSKLRFILASQIARCSKPPRHLQYCRT